MRIAVFADIHGNPFATQAVLDAIRDDGVFDVTVLAGDVCYGGSDPAKCIDMIREAGIGVVYGNTDEYIFFPDKKPPDKGHLDRWDEIVEVSSWVREKLGAERLAWLEDLPLDLRFSPTDSSKDDLLVVHANPKNIHEFIGPPIELQDRYFGRVYQPDDDLRLAELFEGVQAAVVAYGHLHVTSDRRWNGYRLVNVSPCSWSRQHSDRRARYTVFTWDGEWQIERKYVDFDYRQEGIALLAGDMPTRVWQAQFFE